MSNWISINDKLPQSNGSYLTCREYHTGQTIEVLRFAKDGRKIDSYDLDGKKDVFYHYDREYGYGAADNVTHWMPLPEYPEADRELA